MYKRILSFFLVLVLVLSFMPVTIFADEHQHTFGDNKRGRDMSELPDEYYCPVSFYETPCDSLCGYSKYEWTFAGASNSFMDESGLNPLQIYLRWHKWFESAYGVAANLEKLDSTNGGANIPAAGGRNPKGYGDEGKSNIDSNGKEILWVAISPYCAKTIEDVYGIAIAFFSTLAVWIATVAYGVTIHKLLHFTLEFISISSGLKCTKLSIFSYFLHS